MWVVSVARTVNVAEHAARRDAILDAARRLVLSKGYERLTLQDLLDDLQISKGAFYHYFDSKPAVIEALAERLVSDSERLLAPIVQDRTASALDKLQRFFGEAIRWKSARQNLFVAMLPLWYAPDNVTFRHKVDMAVAKRLAPAHRSPDAPTVKEMVATHGAHIEAVERYLGVPAGALYHADARAVNSWIEAVRAADATVKGRR
jgi:AcrR family transcriptional regulator